MTEAETAELVRLERILAKRTNAPGYADNCKAIQARIAELKAKP